VLFLISVTVASTLFQDGTSPQTHTHTQQFQAYHQHFTETLHRSSNPLDKGVIL